MITRLAAAEQVRQRQAQSPRDADQHGERRVARRSLDSAYDRDPDADALGELGSRQRLGGPLSTHTPGKLTRETSKQAHAAGVCGSWGHESGPGWLNRSERPPPSFL